MNFISKKINPDIKPGTNESVNYEISFQPNVFDPSVYFPIIKHMNDIAEIRLITHIEF